MDEAAQAARETKARAMADTMARAFRCAFDRWKLELPDEDVLERRAGFIHRDGWLIQYVWGRDKLGEYLDYYAAHRMTDDDHVRLYASGRKQRLSSLGGMYLSSEDPAEARRLRQDHLRRQRRIARRLLAKGFDKFTLNMMLNVGALEDENSGR